MTDGSEGTLSVHQATLLCVEADIKGDEHYPTDAYMVLAKLATDLEVSTDYLISQAHNTRKKGVTEIVY